jgi:hypothetical protein
VKALQIDGRRASGCAQRKLALAPLSTKRQSRYVD